MSFYQNYKFQKQNDHNEQRGFTKIINFITPGSRVLVQGHGHILVNHIAKIFIKHLMFYYAKNKACKLCM